MQLTPEKVSDYVSFVQGDKNWIYSACKEGSHRDMAHLQAEGVAGLYARLSNYGVALLADEVGTGKTFQALALAAIKLKENPGSRILILTPRQAVADQWPSEYATLLKEHFKGLLTLPENTLPTNIPVLERLHSVDDNCVPNQDWVKEPDDSIDLKTDQIIVAKFSSFSYLKPHADHNQNESVVKDKYGSRIEKIKTELSLDTFNLVIIDEAHYFRHSGSNRHDAAMDILPFTSSDCQYLLLTATPTHTNQNDICGMLQAIGKEKSSYFECGDDDNSRKTFVEEIFKKIAVRRYRRLTSKGYTKVNYRKGVAIPSDFADDPNSELFYAMYQRQLVECFQKNNKKHKSSLNRYLEGIEFDPKQYVDKQQKGSGPEILGQSIDFNVGHDSKLLIGLIDAYQETIGNGKELPSNPKYKSTVDEIWRLVWPEKPEDYGKSEKVLVFSRRIASTKELSAQLIRRFDFELWKMILEALKLNPNTHIPANRNEFSEFLSNYSVETNSNDDEEGELDLKPEPSKLEQESSVLSWFRREHGEEKSTAASLFRRRFEKSSKSDFKNFFDSSPKVEKSIFKLLNISIEGNGLKDLEQLLRKAIMQASVGVVELFCCYLQSNRNYEDFYNEVEYKWKGKLFRFQFEVEKMIEQYEIYKEKFIHQKDIGAWNMFNQAAPAFAYTGDTKNESVIKRFNAPFFPKVLVATSVLQEGVNLQLNCKTVIHYGHAWAPGDDEQRIGRIDRINGQIARELESDSSSELRIFYPFLAKTHDELALKTFLKNKIEVSKTLDKLKEVNEELYQREDNELSQVSIEQFLQKTVESNLDSIEDPFPASPFNFY